MKERDDTVYLRHILDAITRIEEYMSKTNQDAFAKDSLIQDGFIRQMEIIGEAAKRVSSKLRSKYSNIPWKDIAGMRDKLIHGYFGVDITDKRKSKEIFFNADGRRFHADNRRCFDDNLRKSALHMRESALENIPLFMRKSVMQFGLQQ